METVTEKLNIAYYACVRSLSAVISGRMVRPGRDHHDSIGEGFWQRDAIRCLTAKASSAILSPDLPVSGLRVSGFAQMEHLSSPPESVEILAAILKILAQSYEDALHQVNMTIHE